MKHSSDAVIDAIERMFKRNNISGIVNIPGIGCFSMFRTEEDKLIVLDYAKMEIETLKMLRKLEAGERVYSTIHYKKDKKLGEKKESSYIG